MIRITFILNTFIFVWEENTIHTLRPTGASRSTGRSWLAVRAWTMDWIMHNTPTGPSRGLTRDMGTGLKLVSYVVYSISYSRIRRGRAGRGGAAGERESQREVLFVLFVP